MHITRAVLKTVVVITLLVGGNNVCLVASADQTDLIAEYSTAMGFSKNQVLEAVISDNSTLKNLAEKRKNIREILASSTHYFMLNYYHEQLEFL